MTSHLLNSFPHPPSSGRAQGVPARADPASMLAAVAVLPTHDDREAFLGALAGDLSERDGSPGVHPDVLAAEDEAPQPLEPAGDRPMLRSQQLQPGPFRRHRAAPENRHRDQDHIDFGSRRRRAEPLQLFMYFLFGGVLFIQVD